jgi:hypothetical protein
MKISQITQLQKQNGFYDMQKLINTGKAWKMEGSIGRAAMDALRSGACYLPTKAYYDYRVPARGDLEKGTKGTLQNAQAFWSRVEEGSAIIF